MTKQFDDKRTDELNISDAPIRERHSHTNRGYLAHDNEGVDDEAINDERIFFKSLEEYVDIKLQIRYEIDDFNIYLLEYYLGIIEGLDVTLDELKTHIPNTHFNIMPLVTPNLISKIMLKYLRQMSAERVRPHFCANELYNKINNPDSLITGFLTNLTGEF
jgi:hypothetical protein